MEVESGNIGMVSSNLIMEVKTICAADISDGHKAANQIQTEKANREADESGRSAVLDFYRNRSVFITGGSGFIGKVLIEKLLRACTGIRQIFVLMRPKLNKNPHKRLEELLSLPLFDRVRELGTDVEQKVVMVEGDITEPHLGLSEENLLRVMNEVSVIFHSAATVKFDEPLKLAVLINIAGLKNVIGLCRKIPQLASLVYISTAYANCDKKEIDEHIYPVGELDPENLIEMANWLDQDTLQQLKVKLLDARPNTYTYTKALAEWLLVKSGRDLPVVVCRPSIVVASHREPFSGWIEGLNGPTGIIVGMGKGLLRTMLVDKSNVIDFVPVDSVINLIIPLGWFAHVYKNQKQTDEMTESPLGPDTVSANNSKLDDAQRSESPDYTSPSTLSSSGCSLWHARMSSSLSISSSMSTIDNQLRAKEESSANTSTKDMMTGKYKSDCVRNYNLAKNKEFQSFANQLKTAEQKQADLEFKLRQFRHNVQLKLSAKNLPEELSDIPLFHCTSGTENPVTSGRVQVLLIAALSVFPSSSVYRYPVNIFTASKLQYLFFHWTLHMIPAYIADFIASILGNRAIFVKVIRKYEQATDALSSFTMNEWKFSSDNRLMLYHELLSDKDKRLFACDLTSIDWPDFFKHYVLGVRRFILKESDDTLNQANLILIYVYYRNSALQVLFMAMIAYYFFA